MLKRSLLTAAIAVLCSVAFAQNKGTVRGILKDSASKKILSLATATVFTAKDTSIITYRLSDPTGNFQLPGIPFDIACRLVITFNGYRTYRKEFTLTKEAPQLETGTIYLAVDPQMLEDVVVTAERPPVTMRNDTLEFNANAFKTLPSALVEDLLKKLPGVDLDENGNITVRGRRVNRLLVDGKEFFGGDQKMATRNLPANIVDRVQVTDDKEQLESNPQITKDEVGQVINIKLKKAIRQGWFGKAYAGGGTDSRHEAGAIVNIFRDTTQISLIGFSNNVNKPAFGLQEIQNIGGFNRSGTNSIAIYSGGGGSGGLVVNDISFGGTGQGIQESRGGGFNFNHQFGKKLTLNLQYFYGQVESNYEQKSNIQRFFGDTVITTPSVNSSRYMNRNNRVAGSINWKIDSMTQLIYRPGVTFTNSNGFGFSRSATDDNFKGPTNASYGDNRNFGDGLNYSHSFSLSRRFKKRGRILNISSDVSAMNDDNNAYNDFVYTFYNNNIGRDSLINQLRGTGNENIRGSVNINFTEPLTKATSLILTNQTIYLKEDYLMGLYNQDLNTFKYDIYSGILSNGIEKAGWKNNLTATLSTRIKKLTLRPGVAYYWADLQNDYMRNPSVKQNYGYVYPTLNIIWKELNIGYRNNVSEPSATDLQVVIDTSMVLNKSFGNPGLKPLHNHTVSMSYNKYSPKGRSIGFSLNASTSQNAILRQTILDSRRVQQTRPVNMNGVKSVNGLVTYSMQYKFNNDFKASFSPNMQLSYTQNYVSFNGAISRREGFSVRPSVRIFLNYKDMFELNQTYNASNTNTFYQDQVRYRNIKYTTHNSESEVIIRWPKHFVWESLVSYYYNPRVGPGIRKAVVRWNAGASFLFLKEDKAQIKISAFDLLKQNVSVYRNTTENSVTDTQVTALTRYFMLSFIYNIRNFSGGKVGGKDRTFGLF